MLPSLKLTPPTGEAVMDRAIVDFERATTLAAVAGFPKGTPGHGEVLIAALRHLAVARRDLWMESLATALGEFIAKTESAPRGPFATGGGEPDPPFTVPEGIEPNG